MGRDAGPVAPSLPADWEWVSEEDSWRLTGSSGETLGRSPTAPGSPRAQAVEKCAWELAWTEACHDAASILRSSSSRYRRPERVAQLLDAASDAESCAFDVRAEVLARGLVCGSGMSLHAVPKLLATSLMRASSAAREPCEIVRRALCGQARCGRTQDVRGRWGNRWYEPRQGAEGHLKP